MRNKFGRYRCRLLIKTTKYLSYNGKRFDDLPAQIFVVLSLKYPSGQDGEQVVLPFGCRKYPDVQDEHSVLVGPVQVEQESSQVLQLLFVVS